MVDSESGLLSGAAPSLGPWGSNRLGAVVGEGAGRDRGSWRWSPAEGRSSPGSPGGALRLSVSVPGLACSVWLAWSERVSGVEIGT